MLWSVQPTDREHAEALARAAGVHRLTAQCLLNRGVRNGAAARRFLSPRLATLEDPFGLPDMERAVVRLRRAIAAHEPVLIFGDSDVDGLTATAILYEVLGSLGAHVRAKLSNRIEEGYGFSAKAFAHACRSSIQLIVLVDCGTNQVSEIERLSERGIDAIIVDHHLALEAAARPVALINPHQARGGGRELCSAGLAFKLAQALLAHSAPERLPAYLDLAALGTLADYVPLLGESRVIVAEGLSRITNSLRPGLVRLCEATQTHGPSPEQVIRRLVPRLNAFGRLGDPTTAWHLLLEADSDRMEEWLAEAEHAHTTTKQLQRKIFWEAEAQVNRLHFRDQLVLVVSGSGWHQGMMGPLASQLAARYGRPTIAIAKDKGRGTGSGRSVPLFNLLEVLKSCRELLMQFGGHAQACGLTVDLKNLEPFQALVNQHARRAFGRDGLRKIRTVDLELSVDAIQPGWVEEMERLAPFGPGNPRPSVLLRGLSIERRSARTGWLRDGAKRMAAKGNLSSVVSGARYDVVVAPAVVDRELVLTVSDAKVSAGPSGPAPIADTSYRPGSV